MDDTGDTKSVSQKYNEIKRLYDDLQKTYDINFNLFFRHLDGAFPDDDSPRAFATAMMATITREIMNPNTPPEQRDMAVRWVKGGVPNAIIQPEALCNIGGLTYRSYVERVDRVVANIPRVRKA